MSFITVRYFSSEKQRKEHGPATKRTGSVAKSATSHYFAATCYSQFNHSKIEVIPLSKYLAKDTTSEFAGLSSH